jgi:16S rRNA U516 pseudouridylate synthase RsuA-like enzyme
MSNYVFSTLAAPMSYANYRKGNDGDKDISIPTATVHIKGGAHVADKALHTPRGVVTEVSDEELEQLNQNPVFLIHKQNGFITVEKKARSADKMGYAMNREDESRPITPDDFVKSKDGINKLKRGNK